MKNYVYLFIKRLMDIIIAITAIIILSPVYLILIIVIRIVQGRPIFFSQVRIGKDGKKFNLYKFRTMENNAEDLIYNFTEEEKEEYNRNFKLIYDSRVTKLGKYLRKTSLDELPQFINILKGEMSLIGPRPIVEKEIEKYGEKKEKFLSVKPGLTGYWQAYATKNTTYTERIEMELYYVDNKSLLFDLKIFFKSIKTVIKKRISILGILYKVTIFFVKSKLLLAVVS